MTHPTLHMNGTSKEALVREYEAAYDSVCEAMTKLWEVTVHGRDYYVQADYPACLYRAQDERAAMYNKLVEVRDELETRLGNILDQRR
jgi:hypothetical protein